MARSEAGGILFASERHYSHFSQKRTELHSATRLNSLDLASSLRLNNRKTLKHKCFSVFLWLGRQDVNGTFSDEDFQNVDDVEEIQKLLDDTVEDESCSE
jgi:hypothetical protein